MRTDLGKIVFIAVCLVICIVPSAGMIVARTDTTTENREMAEFPALGMDGKININYMEELGEYFEDHFAFRNQLVTADSIIQSKVFGVSDMDTVITGSEGWLYYRATLDDYLGQNTISDRKAFNVANNLSILQNYVESENAAFLFTVAPNKNSLYGEYMPYYYQKKEDETKNMTLIAPRIKELNINYADLFQTFSEENEILYLKRDSHWNQKGAVLAYNTILDALEYEHDRYDTTVAVREKTEYGDLNQMLYPLLREPEWNYEYQYEEQYSYMTETESVEDAWIATVNAEKEGTLVMFRDSFGNTLLPLMANEFGNAYFSKSVPYPIEKYINAYRPDTVIAEKVERNVSDFAEEPPIMTGPQSVMNAEIQEVSTDTTICVGASEYDTSYITIGGMVASDYVKCDTKVFVKLSLADETEKVYEAFTVSDEKSDDGYLLYLLREDNEYNGATIDIITYTDGNYYAVKSTEIKGYGYEENKIK